MQNYAKEVPEYMFLPGIEHWEPVIQVALMLTFAPIFLSKN